MNPGALAGATGADTKTFWDWFDNNINRQARARTVVDAILDCAPEDRAMICETILDNIRPGWPQSLNISVMEEASWWADNSTRAERKAYLLACYRRLSGDDQVAFLAFVQGKVAA